MKKVDINSKVLNGNLTRNRTLLSDTIKSFEGCEVVVSIQKKRKTRSSPQSRYYFGCVVVIMQQCIKDSWAEIWSREKAHEFLKQRFLFTEKVNENTGEIAQIPKSTTECSTVEFEEYLMDVREFIKEWFNVEVPLPNEEIQLEL